jgi:hypothetical protein
MHAGVIAGAPSDLARPWRAIRHFSRRDCLARSSVNAVSPNGGMNAKGLAAGPAKEKIADAAARCRQPS